MDTKTKITKKIRQEYKDRLLRFGRERDLAQAALNAVISGKIEWIHEVKAPPNLRYKFGIVRRRFEIVSVITFEPALTGQGLSSAILDEDQVREKYAVLTTQKYGRKDVEMRGYTEGVRKLLEAIEWQDWEPTPGPPEPVPEA